MALYTHVLALTSLCLSSQLAAATEVPIYATPQAALEALVSGLESGQADVLTEALDPAAYDLIDGESETENAFATLLDAYREGYRFVPQDDGALIIVLGAEAWPFAAPLIPTADGWSFDMVAAREEIASREVGANELDVIEALQGYVELQRLYRTQDHDGDGLLEFAAYLISTDGTRDGLFWDGEDSPIGDLAARASLDGFSGDAGDAEPEPFLGYYFRVLDRQGPDAPGGEMTYLVNGHMVAGHAMLAVPADYGTSGVHSFMVAENGIVLEADLGPDTLDVGFEMRSYNPTEGWLPVED